MQFCLHFRSEFDIHLDKEMYYAGETLSGYVLLKTIENFKLKGEPALCLPTILIHWPRTEVLNRSGDFILRKVDPLFM